MKLFPHLVALGVGGLLVGGSAALAQPTGQVQVTPMAPAAAAAAQAPAASGGILEIQETDFDAGSVERGAVVRHAFILKNTGTGPLQITAKPG